MNISPYFKNATWIFTEKFIRIVVTFVLFASVSKVLGPKEFGLLTFSQTIATMLLCISSLGLDNILIHKFTGKDEDDVKLISTAFIARLVISALVIIITSIITLSLSIAVENKIILIICTTSLVFQTYNTYYSYFQAKLRALYITKLSFFSLIITSLIKGYLIYIHADIYWFAISYVLDFAILFFVFVVACQIRLIKVRFNAFRFDELKKLLHLSWPIIVSSIVVVLYTRLDQVMIMKMMGAEAVGVFNVAIRISEAYIFIPTALATAYYPLISKQSSKENICFYFDMVFASAFFVGIFVIFGSYFAIPLLFGEAYADAFHVLTVTVISSVFAVFGSACTNVMIIKNLTYMRLIRAVVGLIINFVLNLFLIPKYGIMGAAYASLASQIFASWISNILNAKTQIYFYYQSRTVITFGVTGIFKFIKDNVSRVS